MMNVLIFDLETRPDIASARKVYQEPDLPPEQLLGSLPRREGGQGPHLQEIVAIGMVLKNAGGIQVSGLGGEGFSEADILHDFFDSIDRNTPTLVTWNGVGRSLPLLNCRALLKGVTGMRYCEQVNEPAAERHRWKHLDLLALLGRGAEHQLPLSHLVAQLGIPAMEQAGNGIATQAEEELRETRRLRAEWRALQLYIIYLRLQLVRGELTPEEYEAECDLLHDELKENQQPHLERFARAWRP